MLGGDPILPNVFLPGAQKAGSTQFAKILNQHPAIAISNPKEPSIFCAPDFQRVVNRYTKYFARGSEIDQGTTRVRIDATTAYLPDPLVPRRILEVCGPQTLFLFIFRDPVVRAYSAYTYIRSRGHERRPLEAVFGGLPGSLEEAVEVEDRRIARALSDGAVTTAPYQDRYRDPLWNFRYIRNSWYQPQLARYESLFGRQSIFIVDFEVMRHDPARVFKEAVAFLELPSAHFAIEAVEGRNPTYQARWEAGLRVTRLAGRLARSMLPDEGIERVAEPLRRIVLRRPDHMPDTLNRNLSDLFSAAGRFPYDVASGSAAQKE